MGQEDNVDPVEIQEENKCGPNIRLTHAHLAHDKDSLEKVIEGKALYSTTK